VILALGWVYVASVPIAPLAEFPVTHLRIYADREHLNKRKDSQPKGHIGVSRTGSL